MWNRLPYSTVRAEREAILAWLLCTFLLACGGCAPTPEPALRFGLPTAPTTLDPRHATDAQAARLCRLLYVQLTDFDLTFRPRAVAARDWKAVSPTRYRVRLRRDLRFHDGSPLTAEDVAATYRSVLDPAEASPLRGPLAHVRHVEVRDTHTIDFVLTRPDPLFPGLLGLGILRAHELAAAAPPSQFTGSGAFRLRANPSPDRIRVERLRDGLQVDFVVVPDETTRALMIARGELDVAQGAMTPEISTWLAQAPDIELALQPGTVYTYLGFNLEDGPTQAWRVRRAIAHAIDRAALVHHVFRDQARLAAGILVPEHWAGSRVDRAPPYDPERARALLAELGYGPARPLRLTYKTSTDPFRRRLASVLQHQLAAVNIRLEVRSHDWGTFFGDIRTGNFELYSLSWVGLQMPDIYRNAFHSQSVPPAGANRGRYASAEVDALIEAAEQHASEAGMARGFRAVARAIAHDLPYLSLWHEHIVVVTGPRARGYDTDLHGQYDRLATFEPPGVPVHAAAH